MGFQPLPFSFLLQAGECPDFLQTASPAGLLRLAQGKLGGSPGKLALADRLAP